MSKDGKLLKAFKAHDDEINEAKFSFDGQYIPTATKDGSVKIGQIIKTLVKTFCKATQVEYTSALFSNNNKFVFISSSINKINFWKLPEPVLK